MRSTSLFVQPNSGFVPFSGGATLSGDLNVGPIVRGFMAPAKQGEHALVRPSAWQADAPSRVRRVETAVLAAICGYFTFGLGKLLLGGF